MSLTAVDPPQGKSVTRALNRGGRFPRVQLVPPQGIGKAVGPPVGFRNVEIMLPASGDSSYSWYEICQIKKGMVPTIAETVDYPLPVRGDLGPGAFYLNNDNLDNARYTGTDKSTHETTEFPVCIRFSPDGLFMFVLSDDDEKIFRYELTESFRPATARFTGNENNIFDNFGMDAPTAFQFTDDGLKLFISDVDFNNIRQLTLSTPFDLTTLADSTFSFTDGDIPEQFAFSEDGLTMLVSVNIGPIIKEYTLATPFDFSTAPTDTGRTFAPGFQAVDLEFTNNGRFMNLVEDNTEVITRYFLGTPYTLVVAPVLEDTFTVPLDADVESITFNPSGSEMFVLRDIDDIELYEIDTGINILEARFTGFIFDSIAQEPGGPTGGQFSKDGLFYFVAGNTTGIHKFTLTAPFDLTTATFTETFVYANPSGFIFSNDGRKLFFASNLGDDFEQFSLTAPYDLSSPSLVKTVSVATSLNQIRDIKFSHDGLFLFLGAAAANSRIQRFSLPNPFDITSLSNNPTPDQAFTGIDTNCFRFADKGRTLLVNLPQDDQINQYRLSTPYDMTPSSRTFISEIDTTTLADIATSIEVLEDRNKLFLTTVSSPMGTLEFDLNEKFNPNSTEPTQQELDVSIISSNLDGVEISNDGTMIFILDNANNKIRQFDLSIPFDLRTAILSVIERAIPEDGGLRNFRFSADGRHLYIVGNSNKIIIEYTWPTPYDIGTNPTVRTLDVSNETTDPQAVEINFDGGKLYVLTRSSREIFEYDLSTNFDVSTGVYTTRTITVSAFGAILSDLKLLDDGTNMIILDLTNKDILHFALTTPFEIDTLLYSDNSFSIGGAAPEGFAFSPGNDIMYCLDGTNEIVSKFEFAPEFLLDTAKENSSTLTEFTSGSVVGLTHSTDGLKLFSVESIGVLREHILVTPFVPKTANLSVNTFNVSIAIGGGSVRGVAFSRDGTKLFVTSPSDDKVYQFSMNAPFDLTVDPTLDGSFDVSGQDTDITSVNFSTDGLRMFITGNDTNRVYQYDLTNSFDIVGVAPVYNGVSLDVSNEITSPFDSVFTSDGNEIFVLDELGGIVYGYDVPFPFDLATATFSGKTLDVSTEESAPTAIDIDEEGLQLFITGSENRSLLTYDLNPANDFGRVSNNNTSLDISPQDNDPAAIEYSDDGLKLFMLGHGNDKIFQYDLSEPFILKTAVFSGKKYDIFPQDQDMRSMAFSPDGINMYVYGRSGFVYQYKLTKPFDIETTYYTDEKLDVSSQVTSGQENGLTISNDGSILLVGERSGSKVFQYDLSTVFEITSATYSNQFLDTSSSGRVRGIEYSNNGDKLFFTNNNTNVVDEYTLPTPFSVVGGSFNRTVLDVSNLTGAIDDLAFSKDGLRVLISTKDHDTIYEFRLDKSIDIQVYDLLGTTPIPFETVFINPGTGEFEVIPKWPVLTDLEGIQVLAGKEFADNLSDPATVWSAAQYKSVKHLAEINGSTVKDSKLTEDGELFGDILPTTGAVGNALAFNRTLLDGYIDEVNSDFLIYGDDARTISIWVSLFDINANDNTAMSYGFANSGNEFFVIKGVGGTGNGTPELELGVATVGGAGELLPLESWHKITATIDPGETNKAKLFVDGIEIDDGITTVDTIQNISYIGRILDGLQPWIGSLKGKIVEDIVKIDELIKIDYDAEATPESFYTKTGKFQPGKKVLLADDTGALIEVELQG